MEVTDLVIPPQYRIAARIGARVLAVLLVLLAAFGAGWQVATWRADAGHARETADLTKKISELEKEATRIAGEQKAMEATTAAAEQARDAAQKTLQAAIKAGAVRQAKIDAIKAQNCAQFLDQYWEMRQ